ncbi:MAG: N-methyl-L-tryptophan oxidase [Anaerolineae bacterium]|jgi:monomeric sarcosine oxidase|nr:N-methyl-L-tryptophan oxidase [Anaerolineae bacterium]
MTGYEVIVIGAGGMGSAAAYYLARDGRRVLLLERGEGEQRSMSSRGYSRIIRYTYNHPTYIQLAREVYPLWRDLEAVSGQRLWITTGGIDFGTPEEIAPTIAAMQASGLPYEHLTADQAMRRFTQYRFSPEMEVIYQAESGLLRPSECVRVQLALAQQHGAEIRYSSEVTGFTFQSDSVTVHTTTESFSAARVILTAGAWARPLIASTGLDLPLSVMACLDVHFQPVPNHNADQMPVFIYHGRKFGGFNVYGLPSDRDSGVKASLHGGDRVEAPVGDDHDHTTILSEIRSFARDHLPAIADAPPIYTRVCHYTLTPDEHFIVDRHPSYKQLVIGSPCSGHGFKFSTGIGKILADLAIDGQTRHDIGLFEIARF